MKPTGMIAVHSRAMPLDYPPHVTLEWQDGDVIAISRMLLEDAYDDIFSTRDPQPGETFWIGPFFVRCLEVRHWMADIIACRERPLKARFLYLLYRSTRTLDRVYRLSIITLAVWGLARWDRHTTPSWRNVKGLGKLVAWDNQQRDRKMAKQIERLNDSFKEGV